MKLIPVLIALCALNAFAQDEDSGDRERIRAAVGALASGDSVREETARKALLAAGRAALPELRREKERRTDPGEIAALSSVIQALDPDVRDQEEVDCVGPFALSPDGKGYVVREKENRLVVKVGERRPLAAPPAGRVREDAPASALCFATSDEIAVSWVGSRRIESFDARTGELRGTLKETKPAFPWLQSSSQRLIRLSDSTLVAGSPDSVRVFGRNENCAELTVGRMDAGLREWSVLRDGILATSVHPDGNLLLRWDAHSLKLVSESPLRLGDANLLAASRDSHFVLVACSSSGRISTSVSGGREFTPPADSTLKAGELACIAASPDGAWVALGCTSDRVQLRLATTWELLEELKTSGPVLDVAFSDDGSTLAAQAPEKLHIFDVRPR